MLVIIALCQNGRNIPVILPKTDLEMQQLWFKKTRQASFYDSGSFSKKKKSTGEIHRGFCLVGAAQR